MDVTRPSPRKCALPLARLLLVISTKDDAIRSRLEASALMLQSSSPWTQSLPRKIPTSQFQVRSSDGTPPPHHIAAI